MEDRQEEPRNKPPGIFQTVKAILVVYHAQATIVLTPIIGAILFLRGTDANETGVKSVSNESKCAFTLFIMAIFWTSQAMPLAVTSLLPIFSFAMLNIDYKSTLADPDTWTSAGESSYNKKLVGMVTSSYTKDLIFLFIAGFTVALAIEEYLIHKRIALFILSKLGARPSKLMFGFMMLTAVFSMWISNTATTALMVPIAIAIHGQLFRKTQDLEIMSLTDLSSALSSGADISAAGVKHTPRPDSSYQSMIAKALVLSVAYGANIGGIATTIGTPTNLVLMGQVSSFPEIQINFLDWMKFALPLALVSLLICWVVLVQHFIGFSEIRAVFGKETSAEKLKSQEIKDTFRRDLKQMGPLKYPDKLVSIYFALLALLWMTRDMGKNGWIRLMPQMKDSAAGILIAVLVMITPSQPNLIRWLFCGGRSKGDRVPRPAPPLLSWSKAQRGISWDLVLLLGGGFALAKMCKISGLSKYLGDTMGELTDSMNLSDSITILFLTTFVCFTTEFTSNVSTASIFLPIMGEMARTKSMAVESVMIPATIACSFAFTMPISTPPNAIAFSSGHLTTLDLMKAGIKMNILLIIVTWLYCQYTPMLDMFHVPDINATMIQ